MSYVDQNSSEKPLLEKVSKLEAARRQLATAISLWFTGGDTVSTYALSHAAYEVIHNYTRPNRKRELLFDSLIVKDEYRKEFNSHLRNPANFFKHAQRGKTEDPEIEFSPATSDVFILFSIFGLAFIGKSLAIEERAFYWWAMLHKPSILTEEGRKLVTDAFPGDNLVYARDMEKGEFFERFIRVSEAISGRTVPAHM